VMDRVELVVRHVEQPGEAPADRRLAAPARRGDDRDAFHGRPIVAYA
jgi:hypothetical protein